MAAQQQQTAGSRLRGQLAVTKTRTARVLPDPSIESSEHLSGGAVSMHHQPPRSRAVSRNYHAASRWAGIGQ
jgi:hypothetical protein